LVFDKNAIFFAENCQKSQKIVIITLAPGLRGSKGTSELLKRDGSVSKHVPIRKLVRFFMDGLAYPDGRTSAQSRNRATRGRFFIHYFRGKFRGKFRGTFSPKKCQGKLEFSAEKVSKIVSKKNSEENSAENNFAAEKMYEKSAADEFVKKSPKM
jgi:hypothetical protein